MVAVEPYGGLLINSWLDRDLGLAGRVAVRDDSAATGVSTRLFHDRAPLLRVAQLAIHLDRGVNERGLVLNPQQHLVPLWGERQRASRHTRGAGGRRPGDACRLDAMLPTSTVGASAAPRSSSPRRVWTTSRTARRPALLAVAASGGTSADQEADAAYRRSRALRPRVHRHSRWWGPRRPLAGARRTIVASADMARHAPQLLRLRARAPIEMNAARCSVQTERYATDAVGAAALHLACEQADVPLQVFVTRSDLPCGSTIGPITAGQVGVTTVDLGAPMLSMHSIRELAGVADQAMYAAALAAFLAPVP
jgi:aspartyl aminopeptidase